MPVCPPLYAVRHPESYDGAVTISNGPTFAVHCRFLKRALQSGGADLVLTICMHPAREGSDCVGPFLEDLTTDCRLWESQALAGSLAAPQAWRGGV